MHNLSFCLDTNLSISLYALQYTTLAILNSDWILLQGEKLPVEFLTVLISIVNTGTPTGLKLHKSVVKPHPLKSQQVILGNKTLAGQQQKCPIYTKEGVAPV